MTGPALSATRSRAHPADDFVFLDHRLHILCSFLEVESTLESFFKKKLAPTITSSSVVYAPQQNGVVAVDTERCSLLPSRATHKEFEDDGQVQSPSNESAEADLL